MSLKKNVLANYLGQGWRVLMSLAFVPMYIKYLGIEAYGLIGVFAMLQAWLSLLDIGMRPALGREMARFTGGAHDAQSIWDLLRSIEIVSVAIAVLVAIGIWASSGWLAADWVRAQKLPVELVTQAFALIGAVTALQFVESIYTSSIAGLQRQVLQNVVASLMATVRGLGAVGVLIWVSPTITAFFVWQGLISLVSVAVLAGVVYRVLPLPPHPARFSMPALIGIWRYAAGMVGITLLVLLLTQVDKLLLSRLLTLEGFAHYALAGVVASALYTLTGPITSAFYPRFTELAMRGDANALRAVYHQGAQLVTVLMGAAAVVLMIFGDRVLLLWTSDPVLAQQVAPLMIVLALGSLLNGLMWIPYQLQLAHGWTALTIKVNSIAVSIMIPAILWVVPAHGAIGAAWVWVTLNAGYVVFAIYFMHRRLLPTEKWRWYRQDVAIPLATATATALVCRWAMPEDLGRLEAFVALVLSSCCVLITAALAAPMVRHQLARHVPSRIKEITAKTLNYSR
jgi:O-antigen/teichoic acid export membrane protein